jgi:mannosyltransferase
MASGTAVVASDAGAHADVLAADAGRLVPAGNGGALTAAIAAVMDLPAGGREAMGRAGRARAVAAFGIEREVAAIEAIYRALLAAP